MVRVPVLPAQLVRPHPVPSVLVSGVPALQRFADGLCQRPAPQALPIVVPLEMLMGPLAPHRAELLSLVVQEVAPPLQRGDLITANLYRMKSGEKVLHAENYYEDGCPTIDIPLDPLLSPQQNAAKNYKQYNKLKTAEFHLREQIEKAENERAYLESVLQELSQAETEQEFNEIRRELQETNYLKKSSGGKKELKRAFAPRTFKTSSGLEVLVGRSNVQNDQLTKKADKRDYWFHTQHIHGSHVILRCAGLTPSDDDLREAAMLASYFSQAKESSSVPVDYCPVKFVKKPAGARPGMVTYDNYRTLYVTPEEGLVKKLFLR